METPRFWCLFFIAPLNNHGPAVLHFSLMRSTNILAGGGFASKESTLWYAVMFVRDTASYSDCFIKTSIILERFLSLSTPRSRMSACSLPITILWFVVPVGASFSFQCIRRILVARLRCFQLYVDVSNSGFCVCDRHIGDGFGGIVDGRHIVFSTFPIVSQDSDTCSILT